MKRFFAFFLILSLALSLCACGKKKDPAAPEAAPLAAEGEQGWSVHYLPLPEGIVDSIDQCADGNYIYLAGMGPDGKNALGRYDGETFTPYQVPEDLEKLSDCFPTSGGGLGVLGGPDNYNWIMEHNADEPCPRELLLYDGEGKLLSRQDLSPALEEIGRLGKNEVDGGIANFILRSVAWYDGCLFLAGDRLIFQLDSSLQIQRTFSGFGNISCMITGPQGLLIQSYYYDGQEDWEQVQRLASANAEPELLFRCHTQNYEDGLDLFSIGYTPEGELLLDIYNDRICKAAPSNGLGETLFSFYEAGLENGYVGSALLPWSGGYLFPHYGNELVCLQYGPLPEKTVLTMWMDSPDPNLLDTYLQRYNLSDAPYLVRSKYIDRQEASTELAAGRGPDLYAFDGDGFMGWTDSTVFEELTPYLAASGRSKADFLPSLMEAVNPGEEMYSVPLGFILALFIQNTALQPDPTAPFSASYALPQVQAEEARVFAESSYTGWLDLFPEGFTRDGLFDWLATVYMGAHLDEAKGSCDFDSPDYAALLENCAAFQKSYAPDSAALVYRYLNTDSLDSAGYGRTFFGENYRLVNAMASLFSLSTVLAVSSGSQNKEGAWSFIDYCLSSPLGASQSQISTLNATLEQQLALLASGKGEYAEDVTSADVEQFRALLENTHAVAGEHPELLAILREEAQRFFAGQSTAEEAAAASQSRAALYMAERFG